jgi:hypothetical protein
MDDEFGYDSPEEAASGDIPERYAQVIRVDYSPDRTPAAVLLATNVITSCVDLRLERPVDKAERRAYKRFVVCGKLGRKRYETT